MNSFFCLLASWTIEANTSDNCVDMFLNLIEIKSPPVYAVAEQRLGAIIVVIVVTKTINICQGFACIQWWRQSKAHTSVPNSFHRLEHTPLKLISQQFAWIDHSLSLKPKPIPQKVINGPTNRVTF